MARILYWELIACSIDEVIEQGDAKQKQIAKAIQNKWGASPLDIALKAGGPSVDHGSPTAPAVTGAGTGAHLAVAELSSDPVQVQSARSASNGL